MDYLNQFHALLHHRKFDEFIQLWEGYCAQDLFTSEELRAIIDAIQGSYRHHQDFQDWLKLIRLDPPANSQEALSKMELVIHLERGNLIFDRVRNLQGEIRRVTPHEIQIEFEQNSKPFLLSYEEALSQLIPLEFKSTTTAKGEEEVRSTIFNLLRPKQAKKVTDKFETDLTRAVINNDSEQVRKFQHQKFDTNFLGFNAIEIAKYLERTECLNLLEEQPKKYFKVCGNDSPRILVLNEEEFKDYFGVEYLRYQKCGNYMLFEEIVKSCSPIYQDVGPVEKEASPELIEKYQGKPEVHTLFMRYFSSKIHQGYMAPVIIQWINDELGYGVFAEKDIKKGDYVGEYVGEMRRFPYWSSHHSHSIVYPNKNDNAYRIDGLQQRNEVPFINHSYKPNLIPLMAYDKGLIHPLLIAGQDIPKGVQLTWNYGEDFWSKSGKVPKEI